MIISGPEAPPEAEDLGEVVVVEGLAAGDFVLEEERAEVPCRDPDVRRRDLAMAIRVSGSSRGGSSGSVLEAGDLLRELRVQERHVAQVAGDLLVQGDQLGAVKVALVGERGAELVQHRPRGGGGAVRAAQVCVDGGVFRSHCREFFAQLEK